MAFTPLVAYGVPLKIDGSTNTTLDKARNNVPIVNIANPNSNGLSHNKFIHYNVGSEGLILNNSKQTNINTQLGGIIFGNKGLTNNATLILNEVTSTSRSSLKGWTEVAGQKADLIIANPNGLTINGAGFINTNNITLTTGKSTFDNNQFNGFIVNGGDVLIEGTGLDTSNQDSVNVYSHYLQLNAGINAKNINIKLGKNIINENGSITQSSNSGQVQNLLLDTSALGGMYANRITLVGTDQGLGVNLPPEVSASTSGIFIDNKGNISLQKMSAKGDIQITSSDEVSVKGNLYSEQALDIHADHKIDVIQGIVSAKNVINISSEKLNNQSQIIAGLNADLTQNSHGILNINATKTTNQGIIQAVTNLNLATNELNNQTGGSIVAGNDLSIKKHLNSNGNINNTASNLITNAGTLHANNNTILATTLNNSGDITASKDLNITATDISATGGEINANNTNITANNLTNTSTNILAVKDIDLQIANLLTNNGKIQANQTLNLNAKTLDNQKDIIATNMTVITDDITNSGNISTVNNLTINNTNKLTSTAGKIQADNQFTLTTHELDNQANIVAKNANITATTKTTNQGVIQTTQDLNLVTNELNNQTSGSIVAGNDLSIKKHLNSNGNINNTASNLITNAGTLHANNNNTILATTLTNTNGNISASKDLNITATDITATGTNTKISANNTNITASNLSITDTALLAVNKYAIEY
ncbi:filamentous hemagglutinin N-terminal domain-containing protein [Candidatus Thiodubiliella endoseptemdiera]|uniref:two-partner secretion domain-containing protein n=1 Tax=Candidatus Thiodubiliella endoseptemdiera TaxID=2738886 RepID=UPI0034DFDC2F